MVSLAKFNFNSNKKYYDGRDSPVLLDEYSLIHIAGGFITYIIFSKKCLIFQ